jgi:argininosuccinate synthase
MKLFKGHAQTVGRRSPKSLYSLSLATYDKGDKFDQSAAVGFIHLWGLPVTTQAQVQLLSETEEPMSLIATKKLKKRAKPKRVPRPRKK